MKLKIILNILFTGVFFTMLLFLVSCSDDTALTPVIVGLTPDTGFAEAGGAQATTVVITGANFNVAAAANEVKFNGIAATISMATASQLTTTVPAGATTGKITVTANGQTAISATDFVVSLPTVSITSFSPASCAVGSAVSIVGTNFSTDVLENIVKINGIQAVVTAASTTQLTIIVPGNASSGLISVTVNGFTSSTSTFITIVTRIVYDFFPKSAVRGTSITITGAGFLPVDDESLYAVVLNGALADISEISETEIKFTVPAAAPTGSGLLTLHYG